MEKEWCVYVHISPSNKYYVGITCQKPYERWGKNGKGYFNYGNDHFEKAINKYGWNNFQHEIIASHLTENEAKNFEKLLIKKLNSNNPNYGYNKTGGGDGFLGVQRFGESNSFYGKHHTDETKRIISEALGRPVCQFDLELNFIAEYPSIKVAAEQNGIPRSMIYGCATHQVGYKTAYQYVWILKDELSTLDLDEIKKSLKHEKLPKPIVQFDLNYNFIKKFNSIGEASCQTGIPASNISYAISERVKTSHNFIWIAQEAIERSSLEQIIKERKEKFPEKVKKQVYQFDLNKNLIKVYNSKVEAGKAIGVTPQAIRSACRSKSHQSKGFLWSFEKEV